MSDLRRTTKPCNLPRESLDFVVGQNRRGLWLAVETHGHCGGLFVTREDALRYAASECAKPPSEIRVSREPIELRI